MGLRSVCAAALMMVATGIPAAMADAQDGDMSSGERIADIALEYVDKGLRPERTNCSGLALEILDKAGVKGYSGSVAHMFSTAEGTPMLVPRGQPLELGDVLIFDHTYIREPRGTSRLDYPLTHTAVVAERNVDGSWTAVHWSHAKGGPARLRLDPLREHDASLNDQLAMPGHPPLSSELLAGELLRASIRVSPPPREPKLTSTTPTSITSRSTPLASATTDPWARPLGLRRASRERYAASRRRAAAVPAARPSSPEQLVQTARAGQALAAPALDHLGCHDLWVARNTIFAGVGYDFTGTPARAYFSAQAWHHPVPGLVGDEAWALLNEEDREKVGRILEVEHTKGCR